MSALHSSLPRSIRLSSCPASIEREQLVQSKWTKLSSANINTCTLDNIDTSFLCLRGTTVLSVMYIYIRIVTGHSRSSLCPLLDRHSSSSCTRRGSPGGRCWCLHRLVVGPIPQNVTTLYYTCASRATWSSFSLTRFGRRGAKRMSERTNERRVKRTVTEGEMSSESTRVRARKGKREKEKKSGKRGTK